MSLIGAIGVPETLGRVADCNQIWESDYNSTNNATTMEHRIGHTPQIAILTVSFLFFKMFTLMSHIRSYLFRLSS